MGRKLNRVSPAIALLAACMALPMPSWGQEASALDLIKRVREAAPKGPFTAKGTLSSDRGWTREFELSHKWTDGVSATLHGSHSAERFEGHTLPGLRSRHGPR